MEGHGPGLANAHGATAIRHLIAAALALLLVPAAGAARVVALEGGALEGLAGRERAAVDVAVYRDGTFQAVPHQWLAWSNGQGPYFERDPDSERDSPVTRIAAADRLLVDVPEDGGDSPSDEPPGLLGTLIVGDGDDARTLYLLARPASPHPAPKRLRQDPLRLRTDDFELRFRDDNLFQWGDFFHNGYTDADGTPRNLLDSLKLRLSAGVFSAGARLTLTNENLDPEIRQVIDGPLATLVYARTRVRVAGLPVLKVHNFLVIRDRGVAVHARFRLPGFAAAVLREPGARVTVDGHDLTGARLRTSWTGARQARVDGRLDADERAMVDSPVPTRNWLWFDTGKGFAMLARLNFAAGFGTGARFLYQDDPTLDDGPERFPGQMPNVGFALDRIPFGESFYFMAELDFSEGGPGALAEARRARPAVRWRPATD